MNTGSIEPDIVCGGYHSFQLKTFLDNSTDQYIRHVHVFWPFQMQWIMVICLNHGDGIGLGSWTQRVALKGGRGGGGQWSKTHRRGKGQKLVSYSRVGSWKPD